MTKIEIVNKEMCLELVKNKMICLSNLNGGRCFCKEFETSGECLCGIFSKKVIE